MGAVHSPGVYLLAGLLPFFGGMDDWRFWLTFGLIWILSLLEAFVIEATPTISFRVRTSIVGTGASTF